MPKWRTVRVKRELLDAVERAIETGGYQSQAEFVSEALQTYLEQLQKDHEESIKEEVKYPIAEERLLWSPDHMWAIVTPQGNVRIGLSDYAQKRLEAVSSIRIEPLGFAVEKGTVFGSVETWMFKFDLRAPVSGKIFLVNKALQGKPSLINKDPYGTGWIAEIRPHDVVMLEDEMRNLMDQKQYRMHVVRRRHFARAKP